MKKCYLAGIAVLSALLIAACGGFLTLPEVEKLGFAGYDNGVEMVNVEIGGTGTGRALTDTTDRKDKVTFYEVVFKKGTNVYRKTWSKGGNTTLRVPVGEYATATDAILFAGNSDKTLIAVGLLTKVNGAAGTTLTTSTTNVTFTLYTLQNNISLTVADSTFKSTTDMTTNSAATFAHPNSFPNTPIHFFPANTPNLAATYQIHIGAAGASQTASHNAGMIVDLTTTGTPFQTRDSVNLSDQGNVVGLTNLTIGYTDAAAAPATTFPADGIFTLGFETPADVGYAELFFNIKTYAISSTASPTGDTPTEWFIMGGLDNTAFDAGTAADSEGGALLIAVGDAVEFAEITVGSANP